MSTAQSFPRRIICLTEETTETLYLLGEQNRIVGVSGYTVRPPEARQKPKVSAFINAKFEKILARGMRYERSSFSMLVSSNSHNGR